MARCGVRSLGRILPGVVALLLVASPGVARAHLRSGTVAVDYRASVFNPETPAYSAQIFLSDRALGITIRTGHAITLLGYLREPVFRLDGRGLWVNAASPTAVVLKLIPKSERAVAPTPRWRLQAGRRSVTWHDARAQGLPPGVSSGSFRVPLIVDGRPSTLTGELRHFPGPSLWPWLAALLVLLAGGAAPLLLRRRSLVRPAAIWFGLAAAGAAVVILVAFALDAYASPGTWIEGADAIAFLAVGVWAVFRAPAQWRVAGAIWLGLIGLATGLLEGAIFFHPIVLAVLPATAVRVFAVVSIGAGLDAAALGMVFYVENPVPIGGLRPAGGAERSSPGRARTAGR